MYGIRVLQKIRRDDNQIRRQFLAKSHALNDLRSQLYLSGTYVRDYLLEPEIGRAESYRASLEEVHQQMESALESFGRRLEPDQAKHYTELSAEISDYWRILGPIFKWDAGQRRRLGYAFLRDVVYPIDYDPLLPVLGSHVVLVLNPRTVDYPSDNYKMATLKRTAALIGATIGSMQVWDLLRSIDYLLDGEYLKLSSVSVYGRRDMGALALYAAAFDERISCVIPDDPSSSHWQGPALLNILRLTDLPEAAGLMAPREIVSLTPLPATYAYTSSIYALYGKKNRIRRAGDLGEALAVKER
jgi:hypothetical protein